MTDLKITKATYYIPEIRIDKGTDVTIELSAQIIDDRLFYYGRYNLIFPDHFKGKHKRLRLEIKYGNNRFIKDYSENEEINLPHDLGENLKNKILTKGTHHNVFGDYVAGDKIGRDKNVNTLESNWLEKYWWGFFIPIIVGGLMYTINEGKLPWLFKERNLSTVDSYQSIETNTATTTLNISDLFSKVYSLETVVERQDFLTKYIGDQIYGKGTVTQISRLGNDKFVVDIKVDKTTVSCQQDNSEENEKRLLILKGKTVNFFGMFTYQKIIEHGLEIKDCQIY